MKFSTLTALCAVLALSACGASSDGKESGAMTAMRAVFAFKACTDKLEAKFGLDDISGVTSNDMDPVAIGKPGEWDVKFTADVTEKKSGRVTRYQGVCHVRRDQPTTLDATFLKEVKSAGGEVRRSRP
jgi:hypothetical protein